MLALSKLLKVDLKTGLSSEQVHMPNDQQSSPSLSPVESGRLAERSVIKKCFLLSTLDSVHIAVFVVC